MDRTVGSTAIWGCYSYEEIGGLAIVTLVEQSVLQFLEDQQLSFIHHLTDNQTVNSPILQVSAVYNIEPNEPETCSLLMQRNSHIFHGHQSSQMLRTLGLFGTTVQAKT